MSSYFPGLESLHKTGFTFAKSWWFGRAQTDHAPRFATLMRNSVLPILKTLALVGLTTIMYFVIDSYGLLNFVPVVYMIPVVIAATRWGTLPAIVASVASFLTSDYFFYPPYYSFVMENAQEVVDLLIFLFAALVVSNLATRLRGELDASHAREIELRNLYTFSRHLAVCFTAPDLVAAIQEHLSTILGRQAILILGTAGGDHETTNLQSLPQSIKQEAARLTASTSAQSHVIIDPATHRAWLIISISTDSADHGVIAVDIGPSSSKTIDGIKRRVEAVLSEAITRLKRLDLAKAMDEAQFREQADRFKEALMGAVSHDLRTPLATILGSVTVLEQIPAIRDDDRSHSLLAAVLDEAKQLDNNLQNLLNAARITTQGIHPRCEWVDPADIVHAAIKQRSHRLADHSLTVNIGRDLPLLKVDTTLIEQAFGQLLENAAKYSNAGSTINICAEARQDRIVLSVFDCGIGLTPGEAQQLFKRAYRSPRHAETISGSGLGLWIANTFVTANGGTLEITSRGANLGTAASIRLPVTRDELAELQDVMDE
jgi:K+-sensing histidine kinase KdpD